LQEALGSSHGRPIPASHFDVPRARETGGYGSPLGRGHACEEAIRRANTVEAVPERQFRIGKQRFSIPIRGGERQLDPWRLSPEARFLSTSTATFNCHAVTYGFGKLDMLVPAYGATIHNIQGSEYPAVVNSDLDAALPHASTQFAFTPAFQRQEAGRAGRSTQGDRHCRSQRLGPLAVVQIERIGRHREGRSNRYYRH
jgi:hypothetical protein